jgi:5-methyltetrahydropteroyltriglutamate--homocysteine methyltransferase
MYEACITGIFPRDDRLIRTWKDLEWERIGIKDFIPDLRRNIKEVIELQQKAGLTYVDYPQIEWHDLFRPFTALDGIKMGPLTRFFETNTFYRRPIIHDVVRYEYGLLYDYIQRDLMPPDAKWKISLPGPYTFLKLSSYRELDEAIVSISNILVGAVNELMELGFTIIDLHEPALVYYEDIDWDVVYQLYRSIKKEGYNYWIYLYFGSIDRKISRLRPIIGDGLSVDLFSGGYSALETYDINRLILGVVDAENTHMENIERIKNVISDSEKRLATSIIVLSNNTHMEYLPYDVAVEKMMLLGKLLDDLSASQ